MKLDNKKIFKEFLRLKWKEIQLTTGATVFTLMLVLICSGIMYAATNSRITFLWIFGIICSCFVLMLLTEFIQWLMDNWKQATKNVYPKLKKK